MSAAPRKHTWRWLRHVLWILLIKVALVALGVVIFFGSGAGNPLLRQLMIHRLEGMTGGRVEIGTGADMDRRAARGAGAHDRPRLSGRPSPAPAR